MSATNNEHKMPEDDTSEPVARHRLAEGAEWKVIQKNTFTRWVNERLKVTNKRVENIETDLSDGLKLISLLEVLSGKKFQKYTKKPLVRTQMLENVTMALKFLQVSEKIKIVNIDSSDIVDHNVKLILGLIWKLILHYAISAPDYSLNNFEEEEEKEEFRTVPVKDDLSPKQKLLLWIQNKVVDIEIRNFSSDWSDGRAIGALVDGVAPGLCPDWETWKPTDAVKNAREATTLAEEWLDVPQLITPEEMCNPRVDELSMMTYLSQFPNAKLKPGAPLRPRANRSRVRVFGPGLQPGVKVGEQAEFTVETYNAGKGDLLVEVVEPSGARKQVDCTFNNDKYSTYTCSYVPQREGLHKILVFYAEHEIPKSPFEVVVAGFAKNNPEISIAGPGVQRSGNVSNVETSFTVCAKNGGRGDVDITIADPSGNKTSVKPKVLKISEGEWLVSYVPSSGGSHVINVEFAGQPVPNMPVTVEIAQNDADFSKCCVTGRGVQKTGMRVSDCAQFKVVVPESAETKDLKVEIVDGDGTQQPFDVVETGRCERSYRYVPRSPGTYRVSATVEGKHVCKSPYAVEIKEGRECSVRAYGPGLIGGIAGLPASFCLETNGEGGSLAFSIEGPSKAEIDCSDNGDGSALITYLPTQPGEYAVHVLCDDEDINDSPFIAAILDPSGVSFDLSQVKVIGSVTSSDETLTVGVPSRFQVRAGGADEGSLEVTLRDGEGRPVEVALVQQNGDVREYQIIPERSMRHTLIVSCHGIMAPCSPFKFVVSDPSDVNKVELSGPALDNGASTSETTYLIVDCSKAGPGDVAIMLSDSTGADVPMETEEQGSSSFKVIFRPPRPGRIEGKVFFADQEIPLSPFYINVRPSLDLSKVRVEGLARKNFLESPMEFSIDAKSMPGIERVKVVCETPSGVSENIPVQRNVDGSFKSIIIMHEEGPHKVTIFCEDLPIADNPYILWGVPGCDPSVVEVQGPGIEGGITNDIQSFSVRTAGAGQGGLNVSVSGPSEAKMTCRDNRDGTCTVEYLPIVRGLYEVSVLFGEQHVPGSPFKVEVKDKINPAKIRFDDLEGVIAKKGHESKFKVDTSLAGKSDIKVLVTDAQGVSKQLSTSRSLNGIHSISFLPDEEGLYTIEVWYGGERVKISKVQVHPSFDASKASIRAGHGSANASMETSFCVDVSEAGEAELVVKIEDHLGNPVDYKLNKESKSLYRVSYRPNDVGHCAIEVFYGGDALPDSPLRVPVVPIGDVSRVKILGGKDARVSSNEDVCISLSHADAGPGRIWCRVESDGKKNIPVRMLEDGGGKSEIVYRLPETGMYNVRIFFGGREVPEGNFLQEALSAADFEVWRNEVTKSTSFVNGEVRGDLPNGLALDANGDVFDPFLFNVPVGPVFGFIKAEVVTPRGITEVPEVVNNNDGTVTAKYLPTQRGDHQLNISYNENPLEGYSPFHFKVNSRDNVGKVKATGPGLSAGICNSTCSFNLAFNDSDYSGLVISIDGPSKVIIDLEDGDDDSVNVYYKPQLLGDYVISILYSHQHVEGSPFTSKILPLVKDSTLAQMAIGSNRSEPIDLGIEVLPANFPEMTCLVGTPLGVKHTAMLKILDGNKLGVLFDAKEPGSYVFELYHRGLPVRQSPVVKSISRSQCSDADSVRVYGPGLLTPKTKSPNEFFINYKNAGVGGLNMSIDGPSKVELDCAEDDDGVCKIVFSPSQPGTYILNILFSLKHVLGSPFLLEVVGEGDDGSDRTQGGENLVQSYSAISHVGRESLLNLMIPASVKEGLRVFVSGPSGFVDSCYFVPSTPPSTHYSIGFVPKETGVHLVHISDGKVPLPGSPFTFIVGPLFSSSGCQSKVRVLGSGLSGGHVGVPGSITIDSRQAGEGNLSITMEGVLKPDINFKDRHDGTCDVVYTCSKPGDYLLSIKFNGKHVRGSPFAILIKGHGSSSSNKKNFNPDQPAFLEVSGGATAGKPEAIVKTPSGAKILPIVQEKSADSHIVRFIPRERGLHLVEVFHDGVQVRDSPYKIFVGEISPDPTKIVCSGSGLNFGRAGEYSEFQVSTDGSGFGPLEVSVEGPSNVNLACLDSSVRPLKFLYKPSSPGTYKINISFAGGQVPSSPFVAKILGSGRPLPWNETSNFLVNISQEEGSRNAA